MFLLTICSFLSFAQTQRLSGKVINNRNEPIVGATVKVAGSSIGTSTDVEGRFSLNLNSGTKYSLEITSVGYSPKQINDVEVFSGQVSDLDVALDPMPKSEKEVVVRTTTRRQESTASLLNFQKNNTAMSSGLAADFIRRTPDRNTGEVLKRVSGTSIQDNRYVVVRGLSDRYNQAFINSAPMPSSEPDRKAFSFDLIPSQMIDNIIINKTATPDMTGEFAGGLIQINTKDIPSRNVLSVGVSLGYNTQTTFKDFTSNPRNSNDWIGFDDGTRALPSSAPSIEKYRALPLEEKIKLTKNFPGDVYREEVKTAAPITTINLTWTNAARLKNGGNFGTVVSLYHRRGMITYDEVERGRFESEASGRAPIFTGTEVQNRYSVNAGGLINLTYVKGKNKISFKNLFNQLFEDNYYSRSLVNTGRLQNVSLRSSFLNQRSLYSGQLEGEHSLATSGIKLSWNGNFSSNNKKQPDFRTAQYVQTLNNPDEEYEMDDDDTRRFYSQLEDYAAGLQGSLSIPFTLSNKNQLLKFGGSSFMRFRDFRSRVFRYRPSSNSVDITRPYNEAFLPENINSDGLYLDEQTQNTDKYFSVSALDATYIMLDNRIGENVRLIWGIRAEYFQQFLTSRDLALKRVVVANEKWDFLPSLNLTYSFNPKHQLRLSASRTVARPEFREIAPFQFFDYEQIWGIAGNVDLKRTSILNGDIRYEYYPKSGEIISLGVLYKNFTNPIELRMDPGSNSDRWLFGYANAKEATLLGAELEIRKGLDFINEKLEGFTLIANVTGLSSSVVLNTVQADGKNTEQDRPLYGQSPYLINGGFQYSSTSWNASLLYNRIGSRLYLVGDPKGAGFYDIYEAPRNLLDFQASKKILKGNGELKLSLSDILNNRFAFYDNPSEKIGLKGSEGDRINYSYKPGTTVTVGFTYDFNLKKNK
jgi:hypothetical protein